MGLRSLRLALCAVVAVCASGGGEALTNGDIVRLTQAGFGAAVLVAKIESSETAFDTSVDALLALAQDGVPEEVVAAMVQTAMTRPRAAPRRRRGARNRGGGACGGTAGCAAARSPAARSVSPCVPAARHRRWW